MKRNKAIEKICGNCKLFNPQKLVCQVVVLHEGERVHIPVDPEDSCFFEQSLFDPISQERQDFVDDLKEVKFWVEDDKGNKTNKDGTVKIEYPEGFFG